MFQRLHPAIVQELAAVSLNKAPEDRLLSVPNKTAEVLYRDLEKLNIPKLTAEGKLDFHALRVGFITLVLEANANVKKAQTCPPFDTESDAQSTPKRAQSGCPASRTVDGIVLGHAGCPTAVQQGDARDGADPARQDATPMALGSTPATAGFRGLLEAGRQVRECGLKLAQLGLTTDSSSKHQTLEVVAETDAGRSDCTIVVQRIIERLQLLTSASQSALLALANKPEVEIMMRAFNSAFENRAQNPASKKHKHRCRWYIETLRAQDIVRVA